MWKFKSRQYREETSQKISWGHWFAFFNILWAIFIGARYAFIIDWPDTLFGKIYFFISLLGHFSFIVFAFYLLVIFPLSFIVKNHRTFRGLTVILATIGNTLLLVDSEVFLRFNLHLSSLVWNLLVNPENGELSRNWQIFFVPMPLILLVQMLFSRWSWQKLRSLERQKWLKAVGVFFVCTFSATHLIYAWADAYLYRPITMQRSNFPLSYLMTARSFLEKHGFLDKAEYAQRLAQEGRLDALAIDYPKNPLVFAEQQENTNILLITLSGLRHDVIDAEKMPNLTQFAENSTQFINHYSSGNNNNTGLVGLFYGLNGSYTDSLLSNKTPSVLVERLTQQQYLQGVFSSKKMDAGIFRRAIYPKTKLVAENGNQAAIRSFTRWLDTAKTQNKPFWGYLSLNIEPNLTQEKYEQQLADIDASLGQLLPELDLPNTLVIITAEHGYTFKKLSEKEETNYFSRDEVQVPMIVHWNGLATGKISKLTSHVDLVPALMKHIFKVKNPIADYAQGRDLFDLTSSVDWVLVSNYRWNVIVQPDGTQYHIDNRGNYEKYDRTYQKMSSERPPLGLFLEAFSQERSFLEK
jgi:nucleoid-associated protein ndpA